MCSGPLFFIEYGNVFNQTKRELFKSQSGGICVQLLFRVNMNTTQDEYFRPAFALNAMTLILPISCNVINCTILLKLIVKPHLWSLVNLFLSLLLGTKTFTYVVVC